MEAVVSSLMDKFHLTRLRAAAIETVVALIAGVVICLGYNGLYFNITLPNGSAAQILDVMDYISNNIMMPVVAIGTCILIGWVLGPKTIIDEAEKTGHKFHRRSLYQFMIRFAAPILLLILLLKSLGIITFI